MYILGRIITYKKLNVWATLTRVLICVPKNYHVGMAFLHEEVDHNHTDEKKEYGVEGRYSSEPLKGISHW